MNKLHILLYSMFILIDNVVYRNKLLQGFKDFFIYL